jgi:hypothetical protein
MADARPVTDDWVERDIMVAFSVAFWRAVIAKWAIGCAAGGSLHEASTARSEYLGRLRR